MKVKVTRIHPSGTAGHITVHLIPTSHSAPAFAIDGPEGEFPGVSEGGQVEMRIGANVQRPTPNVQRWRRGNVSGMPMSEIFTAKERRRAARAS